MGKSWWKLVKVVESWSEWLKVGWSDWKWIRVVESGLDWLKVDQSVQKFVRVFESLSDVSKLDRSIVVWDKTFIKKNPCTKLFKDGFYIMFNYILITFHVLTCFAVDLDMNVVNITNTKNGWSLWPRIVTCSWWEDSWISFHFGIYFTWFSNVVSFVKFWHTNLNKWVFLGGYENIMCYFYKNHLDIVKKDLERIVFFPKYKIESKNYL